MKGWTTIGVGVSWNAVPVVNQFVGAVNQLRAILGQAALDEFIAGNDVQATTNGDGTGWADLELWIDENCVYFLRDPTPGAFEWYTSTTLHADAEAWPGSGTNGRMAHGDYLMPHLSVIQACINLLTKTAAGSGDPGDAHEIAWSSDEQPGALGATSGEVGPPAAWDHAVDIAEGSYPSAGPGYPRGVYTSGNVREVPPNGSPDYTYSADAKILCYVSKATISDLPAIERTIHWFVKGVEPDDYETSGYSMVFDGNGVLDAEGEFAEWDDDTNADTDPESTEAFYNTANIPAWIDQPDVGAGWSYKGFEVDGGPMAILDWSSGLTYGA